MAVRAKFMCNMWRIRAEEEEEEEVKVMAIEREREGGERKKENARWREIMEHGHIAA